MTYRSIDVSAEPAVVPADQPAPMLDWIPIARLLIDDRYQRPLTKPNWAAIRKIAADFHWSRFTPVLVAPVENGLYAIIDGQHRTHAAAICGFKTVPAMAVHMTRAEQASAFTWVNGQVVPISIYHVYKAALAAGEGWALRCQSVVEAADCRLMTYMLPLVDRKPGQIYAVALIRQLLTQGHGDAVTAALRGLRAYDTTGRVGLYSDFVLRPLFQALASDTAFLALDLAAAFRAADPFKVIDAASREAALDGKAVGPARRDAFVRLFRLAQRAAA